MNKSEIIKSFFIVLSCILILTFSFLQFLDHKQVNQFLLDYIREGRLQVIFVDKNNYIGVSSLYDSIVFKNEDSARPFVGARNDSVSDSTLGINLIQLKKSYIETIQSEGLSRRSVMSVHDNLVQFDIKLNLVQLEGAVTYNLYVDFKGSNKIDAGNNKAIITSNDCTYELTPSKPVDIKYQEDYGSYLILSTEYKSDINMEFNIQVNCEGQ